MRLRWDAADVVGVILAATLALTVVGSVVVGIILAANQ